MHIWCIFILRTLLKVHGSRKEVTQHKHFVWSASVCELLCPWEWLDEIPAYSQLYGKRPSWLGSLGQVGVSKPQGTGEWVSTWILHLLCSGLPSSHPVAFEWPWKTVTWWYFTWKTSNFHIHSGIITIFKMSIFKENYSEQRTFFWLYYMKIL